MGLEKMDKRHFNSWCVSVCKKCVNIVKEKLKNGTTLNTTIGECDVFHRLHEVSPTLFYFQGIDGWYHDHVFKLTNSGRLLLLKHNMMRTIEE